MSRKAPWVRILPSPLGEGRIRNEAIADRKGGKGGRMPPTDGGGGSKGANRTFATGDESYHLRTIKWRGARVAESGSLLRSCAPKGHRGFESPLLRKKATVCFLNNCWLYKRGFEPEPSPTNGRKRRQDAAGRGRRRAGESKQEVCSRKPNPPFSEKGKGLPFRYLCAHSSAG